MDGGTTRQLLRYSRNDATGPSHFSLDASKLETLGALEVAGEALRDNNTIQSFRFTFQDYRFYPETRTWRNVGKPVRSESIKDVLHFISNNSSLGHLEIGHCGYPEDMHSFQAPLLLLLEAASQNKSIRKITLSCCACACLAAAAKGSLNFSKTLEELCLGDNSDQFADILPRDLAIRALHLEDIRDGTGPTLLERVAQSSWISSIDYLYVRRWSKSLITFLLSPHSSIQCLHLFGLDFSDGDETENSKMDYLLWGLMGSPKTTELYFTACEMGEYALDQLLHRLKYKLVNIKQLGFSDSEPSDFQARHFRDFLCCECLDGLTFDNVECDDEDVDSMVTGGLEQCSLSSFKISTTGLANLGTGLTTACCTTLTSLRLKYCDFSREDVEFLQALLKNEQCQLRDFQCDFPEEFGMSNILETLQTSGNIESLHWRWDVGLGATAKLLDGRIGGIKCLKRLELSLEESNDINEENEFAGVIGKNWSLEQVRIFYIYDHDPGIQNLYYDPIITPSLQQKLKGITARNQMKKVIDAVDSELSLQEKGEWVERMAAFWSLPDDLSLAFWLFQKVPSSFF